MPSGGRRPSEELSLCVTSLNRNEQLKGALPLNCLFALPFAGRATVCAVTFGDDNALLGWIESYMRLPLAAGVLHIASGGTAADNLGHGPRPGVDILRAWHASKCKNASHSFAMDVSAAAAATLVRGGGGAPHEPCKRLLCNLDGDNIMGRNFIRATLEAAQQQIQNVHLVLRCKGPPTSSGEGLTGRISLLGCGLTVGVRAIGVGMGWSW
ncbi:MAG: hypothetical protein GY772_23875 [bacterium]|nr:hypothetical protein [bacterium]